MTAAAAFAWGGGLIIIAAWFVVSIIVGVLVGKCISLGQREPDRDDDPFTDEDRAQATLYPLRSFPRRTPEYPPVRQTQRWN